MASEWTEGTLADIADVLMGQSPPGKDCSKNIIGPPLLNGPTEFGSHSPSATQFTSDPKRVSKEGDLLFCVRGSTTGRMNWADKEYALGRGLAAIRHRDKECQQYLRGVIDYALDELLSIATGSTFPSVSRNQILGIEIKIPPLPEQKAIAHILGSLDDKIELNRRMNETLEGMAQALFKSWFTDFDPVLDNILMKNMSEFLEQNQPSSPLLPEGEEPFDAKKSLALWERLGEGAFKGIPDEFATRAETRRNVLAGRVEAPASPILDQAADAAGATTLPEEVPTIGNKSSNVRKLFPDSFQTSELGPIPAGWEVSKSGSLFDVRDGTHDSPKQSETGKYLITSRHITGETIDYSKAYLISDSDFEEVNKRSKVDSYDILLTMIGTVGIPFLVLENEINFAIKNVGLFKTGGDRILATFFFTYLKSDFMTTFLESRLAGTTQKYLTLKILRGLPVTMPSSNIMREFGDQALPIFENIHSNNEETKTLTKLRDTLLPKLISGELRVPQAEQIIKDEL